MNFYKLLVKPFLFLFNPEQAHKIVFYLLSLSNSIPPLKKLLSILYASNDRFLSKEILGLYFKNPIGLAAGFDKNGNLLHIADALGFGFIEIGTVTPLPQKGNEKPRLFRLPKDLALINRMGFNNEGAAAVAKRLSNRNKNIIVGGNIGKNKVTDNNNALDDYSKCFKELFDVVDYFAINVSSPNTKNLRELQEKAPLSAILSGLQTLNQTLAIEQNIPPKPILIKIAPDLTLPQIDTIIEIVLDLNINGIIATNTTISRKDLKSDKSLIDKIGDGGLSGKPLKNLSTEIIRYIYSKTQGKITIIGVGGINNAQDAIEKLEAGASLVQLYTGYIYQGPGLVKDICKKLKK